MNIKTGLVIAVIAIVIIIVLAVKSRRDLQDPKYDERQKMIQLRGTRVGFIVIVIALTALMLLLDLKGPILFTPGMWIFFSLIAGGLAAGSYNIWNYAYLGFNKKGNWYMLFLGALGALNLITGIMNVSSRMESDPGALISLADGAVPGVGILFVGLFAALLARKLRPGEEDEE
ncbi:MAG: hypothetical protein ACOX4I_04825 [Anaerovoracaceae bacterium]|jgi:hypothetical protein